jgi:hypothetical protein
VQYLEIGREIKKEVKRDKRRWVDEQAQRAKEVER